MSKAWFKGTVDKMCQRKIRAGATFAKLKANTRTVKHGRWSCWEWQSTAIMTVPSRLAYWLAKGRPKKYVLHRCDNRKCIRPSHLYDGTPSQNAIDRWHRHPNNHVHRMQLVRSLTKKQRTQAANTCRIRQSKLWKTTAYRRKMLPILRRNNAKRHAVKLARARNATT
jgi:hypothetical protein